MEIKSMEPDPDTHLCVFLLPFTGKCLAYSIRPLVCRLWGVIDVPGMRCPFGCIPERWVSMTEYSELIDKVKAIQEAK
jgi:Fe-S-cluster containining protein